MAPVAGVDGVPGGWVIAFVDAGTVRWEVVDTAAQVLDATGGLAAVGLDIPLGLPETGRRACDALAKDELGEARAAVFWAPPRPVLRHTDDYGDACAAAKELTGRKISLQTFHIMPKIRQWDEVEVPEGVIEVHPELSFRNLARGAEFARKHTVRGAGHRIAALDRWIRIGPALAALPSRAALNDVLDALAAAWSAERHAAGRSRTLGGDRDERGRPMRIVV